jgi:hypothetical protein
MLFFSAFRPWKMGRHHGAEMPEKPDLLALRFRSASNLSIFPARNPATPFLL